MPHTIENASVVKDTGKAILVDAPDFGVAEWIPQSVIHEDSEVYEAGTDGDLIVTDWFARKKGWI